MCYSPWGCKEPDMTGQLNNYTHTHTHTHIYVCVYVYTYVYRLLLCLGHCKQCCYEHWGTYIFSNESFCVFSGYMHRSEIAGLYGISIVVFK